MSATHHNLTTLSWFDSDCEVVISGTRPRELGPQGEPGEEGSNAHEHEGKNRTEPAPGGLLRGSAASAGCGVHVLIVSVRRIGTWRVRSENWFGPRCLLRFSRHRDFNRIQGRLSRAVKSWSVGLTKLPSAVCASVWRISSNGSVRIASNTIAIGTTNAAIPNRTVA